MNGIQRPDLPTLQGLNAPQPQQQPRERDSATFVEKAGGEFARMFDEVNRLQVQADQKVEEFATSPTKDVHGTMIALQKADISLRLFMQVRAKLTNAYNQVMRMQV